MSWLPFWTYSINGTAFALVALSAVCGWSVAIIQVVMLRRADARAAALERRHLFEHCPGCGLMYTTDEKRRGTILRPGESATFRGTLQVGPREEPE